jgi:riboflavin kinase/FMN adenylyltransferase
VVETALALGLRDGERPLVLTFDPHPAEVLGRGGQPVLTTLERKVELLLRHEGLEVVVEPFTLALSRLAPSEFVERVLVRALSARRVIVGENFRFGHQRAGDLSTLVELGALHGFEACAQPLIGDEDGLFSSTRARAALEAGDLSRAVRCLGRPHSLSGRVVRGAQRGQALGFPTANLAEVAEALPPHGVYACVVDRAGPDGRFQAVARGVMNLGVRPTLASGFSIEVHLMDFSGDLYDQRLRVHLLQRLRDERKFDGVDQLKRQIELDVAEADDTARKWTPDPLAGGAWA